MHDNEPLFLGTRCISRIRGNLIYDNIKRIGIKSGLHVVNGRSDQKVFSRIFRHTLTHWLKKSGLQRDYVAEERGDRRTDSQDWYNRIEDDELTEAYDAHIFDVPVLTELYKKDIIDDIST